MDGSAKGKGDTSKLDKSSAKPDKKKKGKEPMQTDKQTGSQKGLSYHNFLHFQMTPNIHCNQSKIQTEMFHHRIN